MNPLTGLRLLLPAIIPSWRFFDAVTASPRLDYALTRRPDDAQEWQPFRPRPAVLTPAAMLRRLFWNPEWNEDLYLVSLAERLVGDASSEATRQHSQRELLLRVARHLHRRRRCKTTDHLTIRLRFLGRLPGTDTIAEEVAYQSAPIAIADLIA